jgi:phosphomannomutase
MLNNKAFKAYDIRGVVPGEVNEDLAYALAGRLRKNMKRKSCCRS